MPDTTVAVLVALYRAGRFIEAKLRTLAEQTAFARMRVVLLNCQNLDGERDAYARFAAENGNVTVIEYAEHRTLYSTWNDGILATGTDYIANSNADDMLHPEWAEALLGALDADPGAGVAHADSYVCCEPGLHWPAWRWHGLIDTVYPLGTAGPCPMWRRPLHDRFGLFRPLRTVGDALAWEAWRAGGVRFVKVPRVLSLYYQEPGHNLETRVDAGTGMSLRAMDLADVASGAAEAPAVTPAAPAAAGT